MLLVASPILFVQQWSSCNSCCREVAMTVSNILGCDCGTDGTLFRPRSPQKHYCAAIAQLKDQWGHIPILSRLDDFSEWGKPVGVPCLTLAECFPFCLLFSFSFGTGYSLSVGHLVGSSLPRFSIPSRPRFATTVFTCRPVLVFIYSFRHPLFSFSGDMR